MSKRGLTVARATEEEIHRVNNLLNELASLHKYYGNEDYHTAISESKEDFPELSKISTDDKDDFIENLCRLVSNMRYEVVIFNLWTLMDNCAKKRQ